MWKAGFIFTSGQRLKKFNTLDTKETHFADKLETVKKTGSEMRRYPMNDREEFNNRAAEDAIAESARAEEAISAEIQKKEERESSLYSYNYRDDSKNTATRQGDYDARRDDQSAYRTVQQGNGDTGNAYQGSAYREVGNTGNAYQESPYQERVQTAYDQTGQGTCCAEENRQQERSYYAAGQGGVYRSQDEKPKRKNKKAVPGGRKFVKSLGKCVIFAAVFGLVAGGVFQGVVRIGNTSGTGTAEEQSGLTVSSSGNVLSSTAVSTAVTVTDVSDVVENVMPSIVAITSMSQVEYYNMFGQSQSYEGESAGSGIIVAEDANNLYVATNNHVVEGSSSLTVSFSDEQIVTATVKGTDSSIDLAVVAVAKDTIPADTLANIKVATLGNSETLKVGESAIAIGNALGSGQSVTTGVISALNREVTTSDSSSGSSVTNELIQTDAAINPGNSGGALLNMNGEVIGINSVKYLDTSVEGMGYAIPISTAEPIINELITKEKVSEAKSAYLGISGADVTSELAQAYNMPEGVYVVSVSEGSAAEKAGIKKGDIIVSFDGKEITSMDVLKERLQYYEAGQTVDLVVKYAERDSYVEETVRVTLGSKVN